MFQKAMFATTSLTSADLAPFVQQSAKAILVQQLLPQAMIAMAQLQAGMAYSDAAKKIIQAIKKMHDPHAWLDDSPYYPLVSPSGAVQLANDLADEYLRQYGNRDADPTE